MQTMQQKCWNGKRRPKHVACAKKRHAKQGCRRCSKNVGTGREGQSTSPAPKSGTQSKDADDAAKMLEREEKAKARRLRQKAARKARMQTMQQKCWNGKRRPKHVACAKKRH